VRTGRQRIGDEAEARVAEHLIAVGWTILARQLRVGRAEIDLIAVDPGPPRTLVFVEVRWRASREFGLPEETVDHAKRRRIRAAAFALVESASERGSPPGTSLPQLPIRFDLIVGEPDEELRHYRHGG
jgi:putative endonuclease